MLNVEEKEKDKILPKSSSSRQTTFTEVTFDYFKKPIRYARQSHTLKVKGALMLNDILIGHRKQNEFCRKAPIFQYLGPVK